MKKKLGILLAVLLVLCMSAEVFADAGKTQQVDYKTDYYMIVQSPDGGIDMYSEADASSPKLNDELVPNGSAIHVEGEATDEAGNVWVYGQLHKVFGFFEENYLKPVTVAEAVASELSLYGSKDVDYDIIVNAKEDGSTSLHKGPGEKYGTVSGGCKIANGEKLHIETEVDAGKDGIWGLTTAGDVSGWVNIGEATNTEETTVELVPESEGEENSRLVHEDEETSEAGKSGTGSEASEQVKKEVTATPTPRAENTPTPEPTATLAPVQTSTPTPEPTKEPTEAPEPTNTSTPTPEPVNTSTPTPEPTATDTPTPEPTKEATAAPEPTETIAPAEEAAVTAAPSDNAGQEASSENVESSAKGMSSVIWILIVVIIIGIAVVIWLLKKKGKNNEE